SHRDRSTRCDVAHAGSAASLAILHAQSPARSRTHCIASSELVPFQTARRGTRMLLADQAGLVDFYSAIQYVMFLAIVTALVEPLGGYMERVFSKRRTVLDGFCLPVERLIYRITAVDPNVEMTGKEYATCFVFFGLAGTLLLYAILRMQQFLPWFFPQYQTTPLSPDLALNTAISFSTTTTWQAYAGENTMSYVSQMVGLCAQNFLAGAAGLAVGVAFIRGLARQLSCTLGNFWVDLTRSLLWILLPGALIGALLLVWQGVPMNFRHYAVATTVEGAKQVIPQGPVAALEIIKNLGTNGGGFFNANGAHPYENPTPFTNFLEMLAIVLLPAALTNTFGRMVGQARQGWLFYWVMVLCSAADWSLCMSLNSGRIPASGLRIFEIVPSSPVGASLAETWKGRRCASALAVRPSRLSSHQTRPRDPITQCTTVTPRSVAWFC